MSLQEIIDTGKALGPLQIRTADVSFTMRTMQDVRTGLEMDAGSKLLARGFCGLPMCNVVSNPRMSNVSRSVSRSGWSSQNGALGCW